MARAFAITCPTCGCSFLAFNLGVRKCPDCKAILLVSAEGKPTPAVQKPGLTEKEQRVSDRLLRQVFGGRDAAAE